MRNTLHPFSKAQYIRPGTDTFLTQNKLAIPVGPKYRRLLGKIEPDPLRVEMKALFKKVIKHISKTDKKAKAKAKAKAVRLEGELSASTMVQGVRGEVIDKPLGQTVGQEKSQGKTPKTEFSEGIEDREKRTI